VSVGISKSAEVAPICAAHALLVWLDMNLRRVSALLVLALAACSSEAGIGEQCVPLCGRVTFVLPRPLPGPEISLVVEKPDGTVERLDCQPTGGSLACLPLSSLLLPNFDASGALQSVTLDETAVRGFYTVQLTVGGAAMGGGSFRYDAPLVTAGPCGETCEGSQSFTLSS
jgi:hypothetical protein